MKRRYFASRRAYYPRLWPQVLVATAIVVPLVWALPSTLLGVTLGAAAGLFGGSVVAWGRLWLWRRQHPQISDDEYMQDMRDKARWN